MFRRLLVIAGIMWTACAGFAGSHYIVRHYSVEDGLSQNTVSCIMQDAQGYMWFGTWDGLNRFDGYKFVSYKSDPNDETADHNNRVEAIWEDSGTLYVRNYDNICYTIQDAQLSQITGAVPMPEKTEDSLFVDKHGIIWKTDNQTGISRYRDGQWRRFCPPLDPRYAGLLRRNTLMLEDQEGNLWVNPTGGGFSRYNYEKDELEWPFPKVTNMIHTAYIDRQGLMWLSTYDKGVDCISVFAQPFEVVDLRTPSDPIGEVRAMMDKNGELQVFQRDDQMVYCVAQTHYGTLLGTKGRGVIGLPIQLNCPDVYSIIEVGETLYIGTYGGGIFKIEKNKTSVIGANLKVRDLLWADSVLIAATTSGLLIDKTLLPYYDVRCLLKDKKGHIWFGTFGGGLHQLVKTENGYQPERQPANSDIVLAIAEDTEGNIWYTGENEITCFQPEEQTYQRYDVLLGESGAYFNESKALRIGNDLVFGYNHGYCRFNPAEIHQSSFVPPLVITHIEQNERTSAVFSFAALDYAAPDKIQYSWKLSGVDKDWTKGSFDRKVSYTNLRPGKYIFCVRSTNNEGVWVNNDTQIAITVQRAFWQTGWMVLIILLVLTVIVWLIWRFLKANNALRQEVEIEQKVTDIKLRFFTNISHELRTPLTLISGPVDNVLTNEKLPASVREQLEIVSGNARRMLRMVNMLLDFRKMQQNQLKLKIRPIHFWTLVEETCSNFNKEAQDKHITFQKELLTRDDLVWVDRDKMDTVLFNLLSNAFKYTPSGGQIRVQLADKEGFLLLSVQDTGTGIPKDKRSVLFERFQSHNELNNNADTKPGSGIGLNLTKELMDMHQGYIEVESEVGKGSTFTVLIRKRNEHFGTDVDIVVDDTVPASAKVERSPHKWSVQESLPQLLIVDDNEDMRIFISNIFADTMHIHTAEDGLAALEQIKTSVPDIIITDLMMPNMDGMELLRKLRQNEETASLPVIMLTAKTNIESQLEGLEHGADDYITKPFSPAFIKARAINLLQQREKLKANYRTQLIAMDTHKQEKTPDDVFLARLMAFMDQQMDNNNLSVEDLVGYMNMGRTVFFNRLKGLTGLSPVEFIREVRIKRAVQLLDMNAYNVTEITYMVGMSDSRYFSKCFKQVMGVTPSEYKRQKSTKKGKHE